MSRLPSLLALLCAAAPLAAQPATHRFTTPDATFAEPFTVVTGIRELRDGRVLVSDGRDRTLQLLDFRTGSATAVGRTGAGPGEWGVPSRLHAMPGDSTLMSDFANGRFLILLPDGRVGPTFRLDEASPASLGGLLGVDAAGRLIMERPRVDRTNPMGGSIGIVDVLRYDRRTSRTDTLGQRAEPRGERAGARSLPGGMLQAFTNLPLAARDVAVVTTDGRLAIARTSPYAVESIGADGRRAMGPPATPSAVRVTDAEKEAFVRSQIRPGNIVVSGGGTAAPRTSGSGSGGGLAIAGNAEVAGALGDPDMTWPAVKPPFLANGAIAGPNGQVWVLRSRAHDDPVSVFDVFDGAGRVTMRVSLPPRTRLAGFGNGVAYLVRTDDDDLQHLERHRMP